MARSISTTPMRATRVRQIALFALSSTALWIPGTAWADCTPATGTTVTCSGTSAAYTNTASGVHLTADSTATVTAPLVIGSAGTITNAGTISNAGAVFGVQTGDGVTGVATVTNNGTITSSSGSSGAGAISVGANATVVNNGVLTAYAATPAVSFGTNGTFNNTTLATAAVSGNIVFGTNTGANTATFINSNVTYGLTGSVTAGGNITATNSGIFTGNFLQTAVSGGNSVTFNNQAGGVFTGVFTTGDNTTLNNAGTMYLYSGSNLGTYYTTGGVSQLTNNGVTSTDGSGNSQLWIGNTSAPTKVTVAGNFTNGPFGTLNIAIAPAGSAATAAGTTYSQLYTTGTANLAGTLNLNVAAGFYPTGTKYNVIDAAGGITGNFSTVTGNNMLFVTFNKADSALTNSVGCTAGICNVGTTEQTYSFVAQHNSYATVMAANGANANQIAISHSLDAVLVTASASITANIASDAAALLGDVDILNASDAKLFLDQISPEGYLAYATALRDQANAFQRQIDLRMNDQNSNHPEDGWWMSMTGQGSFSSTASTVGGYRTRDQLMAINAGYDFSGPHHVWGLAVNLSWDKLHYAPNSLAGTNRDYAIALYGSQNFGPLRLSGQLAYNNGGLSATKTITIGAYVRTATASASENLVKATGSLGFDAKLKGWTLEPFVGIDYMKGKISGFTEDGAGAANLTVSGITADRTDLLAGVSLTKSKGMFRPYFKATYRSKMSGSGNTVTAYMNGESDSTFTVAGLAPASSQIDANAGMNFVFDDAGSLFVGYQGTYRSNYKAHGINVGIRLEF